MWPSAYSFSWNAKDVGPHRDIVGKLPKNDLILFLYKILKL